MASLKLIDISLLLPPKFLGKRMSYHAWQIHEGFFFLFTFSFVHLFLKFIGMGILPADSSKDHTHAVPKEARRR